MRLSIYSLADLFNRTPSHYLWEASSHAAIDAQRLYVYIYPPLPIARYSFIQLSKRVCVTGQHRILLLNCREVGPLHHCATAPLSHCTTAPLRHCITAPLHHCTTAPLHNGATAPLHHCTTPLLRHCATAPLRHCATAPLHHCTTVPLRHCTTAPLRR